MRYGPPVRFSHAESVTEAITHLNYLHVLVAGVAGFVFGCLWLRGPLFGPAWRAEMKFTPASMEAAMAKQGMRRFFLRGLGLTLLGTFGLAVLLTLYGPWGWKHGAAFGAFVGLFGPGGRLLNAASWENLSIRLQAINLGHEVAIYVAQGAILGAWS